jgi:hypothetical protein
VELDDERISQVVFQAEFECAEDTESDSDVEIAVKSKFTGQYLNGRQFVKDATAYARNLKDAESLRTRQVGTEHELDQGGIANGRGAELGGGMAVPVEGTRPLLNSASRPFRSRDLERQKTTLAPYRNIQQVANSYRILAWSDPALR